MTTARVGVREDVNIASVMRMRSSYFLCGFLLKSDPIHGYIISLGILLIVPTPLASALVDHTRHRLAEQATNALGPDNARSRNVETLFLVISLSPRFMPLYGDKRQGLQDEN
ncbi:hypothetical protein J6590_004339 [Homalodisca vitripennis]|nr:hypothetical protein J6590_004339 [Homalodisca vitripennis]